MSISLPPIIKLENQDSTTRRNSSIKNEKGSNDSSLSRHGASIVASQLRNKDLNAERLCSQRSQFLLNMLPVLQKLEIDKFRNSYKHNLCLDMLTKGFHLSFCELVTLIRQQMSQREAAGPESILWTKPILIKQENKLNMLSTNLTKAETAKKEGKTDIEYQARHDLARFFSGNPDDQWLVDHFFNTCLDVAKREEVAETKMLADGLCNVGLCLQKNNQHREAARHFESYHKLSLKTTENWTKSNGTSFYTDSCIHLYNIYTIIGLELAKSGRETDNAASLQMLIQALDMAKNSKWKKIIGKASYNLGLAYQKDNQLDNALNHLFNFYDSCQGGTNSEGTGQACDAIAKIYARQGNKKKSVEFLKRFVELTEKTGLEREYCVACYNLGNVCNSVGNYDTATEYFSKAYNIASALDDPVSANINAVNYGIAVAHRMLGNFTNHIMIPHRECTQRLLNWKCVRRDDFDLEIPDTDPNAAFHVLITPLHKEEALSEKEKKREETIDEEESEYTSKDEDAESKTKVPGRSTPKV